VTLKGKIFFVLQAPYLRFERFLQIESKGHPGKQVDSSNTSLNEAQTLTISHPLVEFGLFVQIFKK